MKKGFTLIELLAVIVILAIIAVIAVPIVIEIIDDTKKNASLRSAEYYINSVEQGIAQIQLKNETVENTTYPIEKINDITQINGEKPIDGYVEIKEGIVGDHLLIYEDKVIHNGVDIYSLEYDVWDASVKEPKLENNEYLIYEAEELAWVAQQTNNGVDFTGKIVKLMNNLDLGKVEKNGEIDEEKSKQWIPIGTESNPFLGTFDGNGYSIKNLYITSENDATRKYNGLFGLINGYSVIKNLFIHNSLIEISQRVGIVAGRINENAIIENIVTYNNKISTEGANAGALVGQVAGTIKNCQSINDYISGKNQVGGITGWVGNGIIQDCYSASIVVATEQGGGIIGITSPTKDNSRILNVISYSKITCQGLICGGIVGAAVGGYSIDNAISYSIVNGKEFVGGIVGAAGNADSYNGIIKNSKSYSKINASSYYVGGLAGQLSKKMENCYDYSSITLPENIVRVGGLCGLLYSNANVTNTHVATIINGNKVTDDNIIGAEDDSTHTLTNVTIID